MRGVRGVLLDIDGVLTVSWRALPGAVEALVRLRREGVPFRLITNTTTHTRRDLATTLRDAGFDVAPDEVVTAVVATGSYLRAHHAGAGVLVLLSFSIATLPAIPTRSESPVLALRTDLR